MSDKTVDQAKNDDIKGFSFEQAMGELEQIVRKLEEGKAPLEDAIHLYERGSKLQAHCDAKLRQAEAKVEKITLSPEGKVAAESFDAQG